MLHLRIGPFRGDLELFMSLSSSVWVKSIMSFKTLNQSSVKRGVVELPCAGGPGARGLIRCLCFQLSAVAALTHSHTYTLSLFPKYLLHATLLPFVPPPPPASLSLPPSPGCPPPPPLFRANGELAFFHSFTFVLVNHPRCPHPSYPSLSTGM